MTEKSRTEIADEYRTMFREAHDVVFKVLDDITVEAYIHVGVDKAQMDADMLHLSGFLHGKSAAYAYSLMGMMFCELSPTMISFVDSVFKTETEIESALKGKSDEDPK